MTDLEERLEALEARIDHMIESTPTQIHHRRRFPVRIIHVSFDWTNIWIGAVIFKESRTIYVALVPFVVIELFYGE